MRRRWTALGLMASLLAGGCVEDAYRSWLSAQDAGSVDGSTDGGPDGGPDASMPAFDAGRPLDGGCPSGCTSDWPTFLGCGPQGTTLCLPTTFNFTGQITHAAFRGPGAGAVESSLAFADDATSQLWLAVAGDGGVRIRYGRAYAPPLQHIVVDDEHNDNGEIECVDTFYSDDAGSEFASFCGNMTGWGPLTSAPSSNLLSMSWLPPMGTIMTLGAAFGSASPATVFPENATGSMSLSLAVNADQIQSVYPMSTSLAAACGNTSGEWWLLAPTDGGLVSVPACGTGPVLTVVPPLGVSVTSNVRMTGLGYQTKVAAVVGSDGGYLYAFAVNDDLTTGPAGWLRTSSTAVGGLHISMWGSQTALRATWLDPSGNPSVADFDVATRGWALPFVPAGLQAAQFVAPMYPNMLLTVSAGQVVIRYVP